MLLKLVVAPPFTLPTHEPKRTGSICGFSIYQAIGLFSVLDNGSEISIGFDKSTWKVLFWWVMVAFNVSIFL
jgi:hypothetical protein